MKKIIIILTLLLTTSVFSKPFYDKDWFEPTMFCIAGATGGYFTERDGDTATEILYAGIGCGVGMVFSHLVNKKYKSKYEDKYREQIKGMQQTIRQIQVDDANRSEKQDIETNSYLIQKEIVPGQKLPDGTILSPTKRYRIINPGQQTGFSQ